MKLLPRGGPGDEAPSSGPGVGDWVLAGLVAVTSLTEVLIRDDMAWRPLALVLGLLLSWAILWRRIHPLPALVAAFGAFAVVSVTTVAVAGVPFSLNAGGFVVVLVFALLRWASTARAALGMAVVLMVWAVSVIADSTGTEDAVGGALVLLLAAALGLTVRYRVIILAQQFEHVRANERESLARELHDTVAHHVSAIAVQAQAGRLLVASRDVDAAGEALRVIEQEAALTLTEMRTMVGALREDGGSATLLPPRGLADIDAMTSARGHSPGPVVEVERRGDLGDLREPVQATLYRVAQESVTNAQRHARRPKRIQVLIEGRRRDVRLTVTDDGERALPGPAPHGYGLVGMTERAALLGGHLQAGPLPDGGWRVDVTIPRNGVQQ